MKRRKKTVVIVLAAVLAIGFPGAGAAATDEGAGGIGFASGGQPSMTSRGTVTANPSAVTWGSRQNVGANYTWSFGSHLATTSSAAKTYLHNVAMTDRVNGKWADNNGPYVGVMYVRGNASGTSWGTPHRLNSSSQHGEAGVIAASGKYVYAAWYRITKFYNYNPDAPRTLYFRRNTRHGAADSWKARLALTSTSGRVGYPSIAASGALVYVAYTDANTGSIRLASSTDHGATWKKATVGSTTSTVNNGFEGNPSVAASGDNVVVSWLTDADDDGPSVVVRVSTDHGANFDTLTTLDTSTTHVPASDARDSRIGVTWPTDAGVSFRLWTGGTWGDVHTVAPPDNGKEYTLNYGPALAFGEAGQAGIAWSSCWGECDSFNAATRVDAAWAESNDNGVTWYDTQVVGSGGGSTYTVNDATAVLWPTAEKRIVGWNGYSLASLNYRMFLRVGTGTN